MYEVKRIERSDCEPYILGIHYAKRWVSISFAFGLFEDSELVGIITYGSPASPALCKGVCGEPFRKQVIELSRLALKNNKKNEASILVGRSLRLLGKERDYIVVSYADTAHNHAGIVYQATNFLFTGTSKARTDIASKNGKHPRHHAGDKSNRVYRSPKHRYITFVGNKRFCKSAKKALRYKELPYPKS